MSLAMTSGYWNQWNIVANGRVDHLPKGTNIEIDTGSQISSIVFLDTEHILTGDWDGVVRKWRFRDGLQVGPAMKAASRVWCLAASDEWVVAGTEWNGVSVWNGKTYQELTRILEEREAAVYAVDISSDLSKVTIGSDGGVSTVWDINREGQRLEPRRWCAVETGSVWRVKFSPDNRQIVTHVDDTFRDRVRVFDTDGKQCFQIRHTKAPGTVPFEFAWSQNGAQLFIAYLNKISCLDSSSGSTLSEWTCRTRDGWEFLQFPSRLVAPTAHGIIVSSISGFLTFWDISTKSQVGPVIDAETIGEISLSPDGLYLAWARRQGNKMTIQCLRYLLPHHYLFAECSQRDTLHSNPASQATAQLEASDLWDERDERHAAARKLVGPHYAYQLPLLHLSDAAFAAWKRGDPSQACHIPTKRAYALANYAIICARKQDWEAAQDSALKSLDCQLTVLGFVAKSIALVGLGRTAKAFAAFDLALAQCNVYESKLLLLLKCIVFYQTGKYDDWITRVTYLIDPVEDNSVYLLTQAQMYLQLGDQYIRQKDYGRAIQSFARAQVPPVFQESLELQVISLVFGWRFKGLSHIMRERLHNTIPLAVFHPQSVVMSRLESEGKPLDEPHITECLEQMGDEALNHNQLEEAALYYMAVLFLDAPLDDGVVVKWVNTRLAKGTWQETLNTATELNVPMYLVYQVICNILRKEEHVHEATRCFRQMTSVTALTTLWSHEFEAWLSGTLQLQLDGITSSTHHTALELYTTALLLWPSSKLLLFGRSNTLALVGKWEAALRDAERLIALDPSSHLGFQTQHAALLRANHYDDAFEAYETMFLKLSDSPDLKSDPLGGQYISPAKIEEMIRRVVEMTIRDSPTVLINTTTGRMCSKSQQASAFAVTSAFKELRASMITEIDHTRIEEAVKEYYQYVMLSHTWEHGGDPEPSFQLVEKSAVYELQQTKTNVKLLRFCWLVRDLGYVWAWSDTCCIDQLNQVVLQESLVSMFRWYRGSVLTIVALREAAEELESLDKSYWSTRGWTYQEYVAAEIIRFYTNDWKPYRGLPATVNHKEHEEVRKEIESNLTDCSSSALRPGLEDIREKLYLASTRKTTREEDVAYSLFGIFNVSMPVIYGEGGSAALGRLLAHLLTASGNASILAWTGTSGAFNSCFPRDITVFEHLAAPHLPALLNDHQMKSIVDSLRSSLDSALESAIKSLYHRLDELPVPSFAASRMKLPCIMFQLGRLIAHRTKVGGHLYRARTHAFGTVMISTKDAISPTSSLYLVHPWLNGLLERGIMERSKVSQHALQPPSPYVGDAVLADGDSDADLPSPPSPSPSLTHVPAAPLDEMTSALRLFVRLRQPFGALLLVSTDLGYRRVASDTLIQVQVQRELPMKNLIDCLDVRTIDIL